MFYVYGYYEPDCLNPFYIGKGQGRRMWEHFDLRNLIKQTPFYCKLRSMILADIVPIVRILFKNLTEQEAFDYEIRLIAQYGRRDLNTGSLFNMTNGGEGVSGLIRVECVDREYNYDCRIKISNAGKKRVWSEETKSKISAAKIERQGQPIESYNLQTGETIKQYPYIRAVEAEGFKSSAVCRALFGRGRNHHGFGWRYQTRPIEPPNLDSFAYQPFEEPYVSRYTL